ncbi:hypothetical protein RRF57_002902 [Xylaria bambusicola]|uniref:Uncharacterized protein n=1 Tax=Xylaria bambusicola TaxID=326684 RepID=A0AAN7Z2W5_9PEZI
MGTGVRSASGFIAKKLNSEWHRYALFKWKSIASHDLLFNVCRGMPISLIGILLKNGTVVLAGVSTAV